MSSSNLVHVTSPEHFTEQMSADLARVSLLNFWAPWAEPCGQMNAVVEELAAKYPQLLVLMVSVRNECARDVEGIRKVWRTAKDADLRPIDRCDALDAFSVQAARGNERGGAASGAWRALFACCLLAV